MDRPLKVEVTNKKNTLIEYTDTFYARKIAKNTAALVDGVHDLSDGIERNNTILHGLNESLKATQDINQKTANNTQITAILAQKDDQEKRQLKTIKNAVFAFKQDVEFVNSTNKGLARFLSLKALTGFCETLVSYINRLEDFSDKEYGNSLIKTVYSGIEESFANLTDPEKDDLNRIERHLSEIGEKKLALEGLSDDFDDREDIINSEISRLAENNNAFEKQKRLLLTANDKKISSGDMVFRLLLFILSFIFFLPLSLIIFYFKWQYFKEAFRGLFNKDARKKSAESIQREIENDFAPDKIQADIEGKRKEMLLLESSFDTNEQKLKQEMATIEQALNQLMVKYNLNV